ncbi:glycosyltransferase [Mesorhizobium sp. AR02]|uniref:glycosyltransferase n=1 Tax=Mesorhizobium sp. AR02 TaxID=2865837 RepID=UPI0021609AC8|nr:glycosyltransferase [Mesorhizobium sp. AR02]UVK51415.1 glycosyltransferase [Mesorhizobium sp. AR02]
MAHGRFPIEYISDPNIKKSISEIYTDIDSFTWELMEDDADAISGVDICVVLPPMFYDGVFVKGLYFSRGVDFLGHAAPKLSTLFNSMAYSMFSSYPWSEQADGYLACYRNAAREKWFRDRNPEKSNIPLIPLAETDFLDEFRFAPVRGTQRDIDVLCVSRLQDVKNIEMIGRALLVYRAKYRSPLRMTLITGHRGGVTAASLPPYAREQLAMLQRLLGRVEDFIDLRGYVNHWSELPRFYSRARVFVLGSLIEGKNRSIGEAMSCNLPVVCFREFNQYARQGFAIMPERAGICCVFDPEALADAWHFVLHNADTFSPRLGYLQQSGRRNFVNRCLDSIPYYSQALPNFVRDQNTQNPWIEAAIHRLYGMQLNSFLYRPGTGLARAWGVEHIRQLADRYEQLVGSNQ